MIKRFGEYILRDPWTAGGMALLFSLIPLFGWMGMVILGLVTLRKGWKSGLWILVVVSVPDVIALTVGHPEIMWIGFLGGNLFVWAMALVLRYSASWTRVLEATLVFSVLGLLLVHALNPEIAGSWMLKYQAMIDVATKEIKAGGQALGHTDLTSWTAFLNTVKKTNVLFYLSQFTTGLIASFVLLAGLINLLLARAWQALLFNPEGLRPELFEVRLGYSAIVGLILCLATAFMSVYVVWEFVPTFLMIFMLAGLSLIHSLALKMNLNMVWLLLFYVMLMFLAPYSLMVVVCVALMDSFINFRAMKSNLT